MVPYWEALCPVDIYSHALGVQLTGGGRSIRKRQCKHVSYCCTAWQAMMLLTQSQVTAGPESYLSCCVASYLRQGSIAINAQLGPGQVSGSGAQQALRS